MIVHSTYAKGIATMPTPREPDAETYDLGHYEAMQLEIALDTVIREMQPNRSLTGAECLDNVNEDVLRQLRHMIGHANVSITVRKH